MTRIERENVLVPVIIQAIGGDLRLKGRSGDLLVVDGENVSVEQLGEGQPYVVRAGGDARMIVPNTVAVSLQQVGGDAKLTDVDAALDIQRVGGDLTVRNVQDVHIKTVGGDLRVKRASGSVVIDTIGADATIRDVDGAAQVTRVGADLYLRNIGGHCIVETVGSDLVLNLEFMPDREYRFSAGSDILCRVRPDTNATFLLPADAALRLDVEADVDEDDAGQQVVTLGEGGPVIVIGEAESLQLVGEEEDYMADFGAQIEEEVEARLSTLEEQLSRQLEGLDERILAKTQHIATKAEKLAAHAQRQAERAAERALRSVQRRSGRHREPIMSRRGGFGVDAPSRAPKEPITEQERLMILQMVQENKISIEEAERLLAALDS